MLAPHPERLAEAEQHERPREEGRERAEKEKRGLAPLSRGAMRRTGDSRTADSRTADSRTAEP